MIGSSVLDYTDYRTFLADYCAHKKRAQIGWSVRGWSRRLGLRSPSTLTMILKGQRSPRLILAHRMTQDLKLPPKEAGYFLDLVRLDKVKGDPEGTVPILERLSKLHRSGTYVYLDHQKFRAVSQWHYYAIREMLHLEAFRLDPAWIARRMTFPVSKGQVKEALATLSSLGLLERAGGRWRASPKQLDTPSDVADEGIKRFHEQSLDNAKVGLRKFPVEAREYYGTTFALRQEDLPKAKELIRKFHRDLCELLERESADSVFHLETAFFPLAHQGGET